MSRSINGDGGSTDNLPLEVFGLVESNVYPFDGELILAQRTFESTRKCRIDINLLYKWVNCTRASRFYLTVSDGTSFALGVGDSVTHMNHIEKSFIVLAPQNFTLKLTKDAKTDSNDTIELQPFSFIKLTFL